ncbi:restriction endonuclease [Paenibacillus pinisoli]|uniref:Restriction endonuclease n=1 Tax=Paenibacillus pinisoli TaxID=1276110 RepID=A0A3A6PSG0_9BACL|nr:restriction endonuclease [Paenibacillus pinisoli]RJX39591.1 restriction endonuclease [Paenibacillus pinisoli]
MELNEWLYTTNYQTFEEWQSLVLSRKEVYPALRIPYDEWLDKYIGNIKDVHQEDVKGLLRCLLEPLIRNQDTSDYAVNKMMQSVADAKIRQRAIKMASSEKIIRLSKGLEAWEGVTWILELLPAAPYNAVQALESYLYSQPNLPDDRIIGIAQCIEIIFAKFIHCDNSIEKLLTLKSVEFEWFIEYLYDRMGYDTLWTKATRDGGKDIIARGKRPDGFEQVYVECKLYKTTRLTLQAVQAFSRVIDKNEVNRGVIFCTGYVSENLKKEDKRIQIWSYKDMHTLLNAHLGSDWIDDVNTIVGIQRRKYG